MVLAEPAQHHSQGVESQCIRRIQRERPRSCHSRRLMAAQRHQAFGQLRVIFSLPGIEADGTRDDVGGLRQILVLGSDEAQQEKGLCAVRLLGKHLHAEPVDVSVFLRGEGVSCSLAPGPRRRPRGIAATHVRNIGCDGFTLPQYIAESRDPGADTPFRRFLIRFPIHLRLCSTDLHRSSPDGETLNVRISMASPPGSDSWPLSLACAVRNSYCAGQGTGLGR